MDQIHIIIQSIFAFCIVNIDEFIVLLLFFTKAIAPHHPHTDDDDDDQLTVFQIISGQIIGFTIIIGISLFGSLFGFFIPYDYLALLGIFPLVLGLYELYKVVNYWRKRWLIYYSRKNSTNALNAYQEVPNAMSSPYLRHDQRYQYIAQRKQSGSYNPSPTDRIRAQGDQKGLSDFELQYEMISSLSYRLNHPQHTKGDKDNYYPRNHDYSSYQNPSPPLPSPLAPILHPESTDAIDSGGNEVEEEDEIKVTHLPLKDENRRTARPIPSSISLLSDTSDDDVMNYYNNKGEDDYRSGTSSDEEEKIESTILTRWFEQYFQPLLHRNIFYVSLVLLSDGSEEIAVFLPFLSTISQQQHESSVVIHHQHHHGDKPLTVWQKTGTLFVVIIVWYLLILCQCYFAYLLIIYHSESYGKWISRYSKNVIPLVLIGLGVIILRDSIIGKILFLNKMKIL